MAQESLSFAYTYGCRNAGDFAINQGSLALLENVFPEAHISGISRFPRNSREFQRVDQKLESLDKSGKLFGGPISYDQKSQSHLEQLLSLVRDSLQYGFDISKIAPHSSFHSNLFEQIANSEAFFFNGGNAIHYSTDHQSPAYLLGILYPLHIARRNNVPYAILPQTTFGLEGLAKRLVLPIFDDAEFIMTRDRETSRYLSEFDLSAPVIDAIDTAFLHAPSSRNERTAGDTRKIAAVPRFSTLGDTDELDEGSARMEQTFFEYLTGLVEAGHEVTMMVQTEIDKRWVKSKQGQLESVGVEYRESFDPQTLRDHYADMDLLVTMRLHAAIFALSVGTPTIGIYKSEWGPKMPGTFETLEIGKYALNWREATLDDLIRITDEALDNFDTLSGRITTNVMARNQQMVSDFKSAVESADGFTEG